MENHEYSLGFTPLFERILIKPDTLEKTTGSGIILPVESRKRQNAGTVISIGHTVASGNCPIKEGDRVLYLRYAGMDVKIDNEVHHLVQANDLVAILEPSKNRSIEISDYA